MFVAILIAGKLDFKTRSFPRGKERQIILIKETIYQED